MPSEKTIDYTEYGVRPKTIIMTLKLPVLYSILFIIIFVPTRAAPPVLVPVKSHAGSVEAAIYSLRNYGVRSTYSSLTRPYSFHLFAAFIRSHFPSSVLSFSSLCFSYGCDYSVLRNASIDVERYPAYLFVVPFARLLK